MKKIDPNGGDFNPADLQTRPLKSMQRIMHVDKHRKRAGLVALTNPRTANTCVHKDMLA